MFKHLSLEKCWPLSVLVGRKFTSKEVVTSCLLIGCKFRLILFSAHMLKVILQTRKLSFPVGQND